MGWFEQNTPKTSWFSDNAPKPRPATVSEQASAAGGIPVGEPKPFRPDVKPVSYIATKEGERVAIGAETLGKIGAKLAQVDTPVLEFGKPERAAPTAGTGEKIARGVGRSGVKNVEGLLTPTNIGIGAGLVAANAGAALFPPALPAVLALNATAGTYFATEMAKGIAEGNRAYQEALKAGATEGAAEALADIGAATAMATGIGRHTAAAVKTPLRARVTGQTPAPEITAKQAKAAEAQGVRYVPGVGPTPLTGPQTRALRTGDLGDNPMLDPVAAMQRPGLPPPLRQPPAQYDQLADVARARDRAQVADIAADVLAQETLAKEQPVQRYGPEPPPEPMKSAAQSAQVFKEQMPARERAEAERIAADVLAEEMLRRENVRPPLSEPTPAPFKSAAESARILKGLPENPPTPGKPSPGVPVSAKDLASRDIHGKRYDELTRDEAVLVDQALKDRGLKARYDAEAQEAIKRERSRQMSLPKPPPLETPKVSPLADSPDLKSSAPAAIPEAAPATTAPGRVGEPAQAAGAAGIPQPAPLSTPGLGSQRRQRGESGAFMFRAPGTLPIPRTPQERAALDYLEQDFDAAQAAQEKRSPGSVKKWVDAVALKYRVGMNDTSVALTDAVKPLDKLTGKLELTPTTRLNDAIDKVYRAATITGRAVLDSDMWYVATRAESLKAVDRYTLARRAIEIDNAEFKTGRDIAADKAVVAQLENSIAVPASKTRPAMTFRQAADTFTRFNRELLDKAVESGVVDAELARDLKAKYGDYVPIRRLFEASEIGFEPGAKQVASLSRQTILQRLQGSERVMGSAIESTVHHADKVYSQINRNNAANLAIDYLGKLDPGDGSMLRPLKDGEHVPSERTISRYRNGVKETYVTKPEIASAAKSLDVKQLNAFFRYFSMPANRLLTIPTTGVNLAFSLINFFGDGIYQSIMQPGVAKALLKPSTWAETGRVLAGGSEINKTLERSGGGFIVADLSRGQVLPDIQLRRARRDLKSFKKYIFAESPQAQLSGVGAQWARYKTAGRSAGQVGTASFRETENVFGRVEQVGRVRSFKVAYDRAIKEGYTPEDATILGVQASNNYLPNYVRAGSFGRLMNGISPYFNANVQGVRSFIRAWEEDPKGVAFRMAAFGMATAAITVYNMADPERRKVWMDIKPYAKERYMPIVLDGATKNEKERWEGVIPIIVPPGLASMGGLVQKTVEQIWVDDPVKFADLAEALIGTFTPLNVPKSNDSLGKRAVVGAIGQLLPQLLKPGTQAATNYNIYRDQPIETPGMTLRPPSERTRPYTSATAKALAPVIGTSPVKVESYIMDTFGSGGPLALRGLDTLGMATGILPKQAPGGTTPWGQVVERFSSAAGGQHEQTYWDLRAKVQQTIAQRYIDDLRANPRFAALDRGTQERLVNIEASKARSAVGELDEDGRLKRLEGPQKVAVMKQILSNLTK